MADQIADHLRTGTFTTEGGVRPRFTRVILAGHSAGGLIAELTQSIFRSADGLAVIGYTHYPSPLALQQFFAAGQGLRDHPAGAHGSTGAPNIRRLRAHRRGLRRRTLLRRRTGGRAGRAAQAQSGPLRRPDVRFAGAARDERGDPARRRAGSCCSPGRRTRSSPPPFNQIETQSAWPGAPRLGVVEMPGTGHAVTFGRTHEEFRALMAQWLATNGA